MKSIEVIDEGVVTKQFVEHFQDILVVATNNIVTAHTLATATPYTATIAAQPDVPRIFSWIITHAQITAFSITFLGVDARGNAVSETVTQATGWGANLNNAFATLTSVTINSRTGTGAGDTLNVGSGSKIGLANRISSVYKAKKNNANYAAASYTVETTYHTVDVATGGAITGGDDFTIWYRGV